MRSLNCMVHDPETSQDRYDQERNTALVKGLTSTTHWFGIETTQQRDNSQHATPDAATACLRVLNARFGGGYSLTTEEGYGGFGFRQFGYVSWSSPKILIQRPDGEVFAAGQIGYILGDEAVYANRRQRDWEIFRLIGFDDASIVTLVSPGAPSISEAILDALGVK